MADQANYEAEAKKKLEELLGKVGDIEGVEIKESKMVVDIPDGEHVATPFAIYKLGKVFNWTAVLDKKSKNIIAKLTKKPQLCFSVAYKDRATGETQVKDFVVEDYFSPNNMFHDAIMGGLGDEEYDKTKSIPSYLLRAVSLTVVNQKITKAIKLREDQLAYRADISSIIPKYWDAANGTTEDDLDGLKTLPKFIMEERSVALSQEPEKPTQQEIEDMYIAYGNPKPFDSLLKKAGDLMLQAESYGYTSTKQCFSLVQYRSHHFFSVQNDEQDTL